MANKARGEVGVRWGGKDYVLALTLEAMAQIEDAFSVDSFEQAFNLDKPSGKKLRSLMFCLARGNGVELTPDIEAAIGKTRLTEFVAIFGELMELSGFQVAPAAEAKADASPLADASAGSPG